ncbi:MAG: hypothetical protein AB1453_14575 [Chloroflexota bacterium]
MKKISRWMIVISVILLLAFVASAVSAAIIPESASFRILRNTITSAQAPGGAMSSASYHLTGAFGGMIGVSGNTSSNSLCIGYICEGNTSVFLPMVQR